MIRRGFWLTTGAVTGIMAYRRVSMAGRRLSGHLNVDTGAKAGPARPVLSVRRTRRGAIRAARETYRFTHDVREGMALYLTRPAGPEGPTLSTNHDAQPEDGY